MGTSSAFGGQSGGTPLVPSWLDDDGAPPAAPNGAPPDGGASPDGGLPADGAPPDAPPASPVRPPVPPIADPTRFSAARNNFSRFAGSGGDDRRSLGRAVSHYVGSSAGGARTAAARMGSARGAGSRLLGFLSDAVARGATEALRALNLDGLAGRPIEVIFFRYVDERFEVVNIGRPVSGIFAEVPRQNGGPRSSYRSVAWCTREY
ncbi:hypothetical protein ILFOPFJJ_06931 [Ensifer psoraleae]|uniref:hypothetical protein n=1 Tax=Sinorhizobium psoraleae TaxID=520838 RepID=UPI00156A4623|nr:hypothetical protein [Sinorhizobium psoraleae]NRP76007.1 hypothetical protein [Sinorhizobium psoraleae]